MLTFTKAPVCLIASCLCLAFAQQSLAATTDKERDELRKQYKAQMILSFNQGKYEWCKNYALRLCKGYNPAEEGLARYYYANSAVKLHQFFEARQSYTTARQLSNDPAIISACDKAISAIDDSVNDDKKTPEDIEFEKMVGRVRDQYLERFQIESKRNEPKYPGEQKPYLTKDELIQYADLYIRKDQLERRQREPRLTGSSRDNWAWIQDCRTKYEKLVLQITLMESKNPYLYQFRKELLNWQLQAKDSSNQGTTLNSVPKLIPTGTDYYTRNYGEGTITQSEPTELVATPERMILDSHSVPGKTLSRIVQVPTTQPVKPSNAALQVRGNLLRKRSDGTSNLSSQ